MKIDAVRYKQDISDAVVEDRVLLIPGTPITVPTAADAAVVDAYKAADAADRAGVDLTLDIKAPRDLGSEYQRLWRLELGRLL